ncbi:MAG: hypothetical protein KY453_04800 [Gemmatimonadetes bacterium]|nr:hypothetical protein [Gemmatimonadota bacterium]
MGETFLGLLFMLAGVATWVAIFRRTGDALHPLALLASLWLLTFGFGHWEVAATYDELYYREPFGAVAYLAVIGSLVSVVAGFWLVDPGLRPLEREALAERLRSNARRGRLLAITLALFAVASATTVYFVWLAGEVPLFSPRVDELRQTFKRPLLGYLYDLHFPVALFAAILADRATRRSERVFWIGLLLASLFQLALGAVRASPLTGFGWVAVYLFYRLRGRVRVGHLSAAAVVVAGVFIGIEYSRRTPVRLNPELLNPRQDLSSAATLWGHTGASFKNLQLTLRTTPPPLEMGAATYDLPKTLVPRFREIESDVSSRFGVHNSATYLLPLWLDFGLFGLLVVPGIYGALTGFTYRRFQERGTLLWLLLYIDFAIAAILAFRTHKFLGNGLIFFGGVALMVQLFAGREPDDVAEDRGQVGEGAPAPAPGAVVGAAR